MVKIRGWKERWKRNVPSFYSLILSTAFSPRSHASVPVLPCILHPHWLLVSPSHWSHLRLYSVHSGCFCVTGADFLTGIVMPYFFIADSQTCLNLFRVPSSLNTSPISSLLGHFLNHLIDSVSTYLTTTALKAAAFSNLMFRLCFWTNAVQTEQMLLLHFRKIQSISFNSSLW